MSESSEPFEPGRTGSRLVGAIEAGGTKVVCAAGTGPDDVRDRIRIPTTAPEEVFKQAVEFFAEQEKEHGKLEAIAIVTFGPVDLRRPGSESYGAIMKTPKPGWAGAHWLTPFRQAFECPVYIDTDVNGAALGESVWGAAQGLDTVVYLTIGTGIGGGLLVSGEPVHGLLHPEVGHMRIPRTEEEKKAFPGACPFHGDCLEGLASGPSMQKRWGVPAGELPADHPAWEVQSDVLAWACVNLTCILSPQRILFGGGVMQQEHLFPMIREKTLERLNGYVDVPEVTQGIDQFIVPPGFGQDAGLMGAIALARKRLG